MGTGWAITSTLIAGMLVVGGLGFVGDRILGTDPLLTGIGIVAGGAVGVYVVYLRFGKGNGGGDGA